MLLIGDLSSDRLYVSKGHTNQIRQYISFLMNCLIDHQKSEASTPLSGHRGKLSIT